MCAIGLGPWGMISPRNHGMFCNPMKNLLGQNPPLVLVIDHEQTVLEEVTAVLASANIACHCCTEPDDALATAAKTPPALILCDTSLFGESGPETCERIRKQPGLEDVPVMFLSTAQSPDIIRRSHGANSTYCVRKPFSPDVLLGLIDSVLGALQAADVDAVEK
jgi:putative two-component system response regulator